MRRGGAVVLLTVALLGLGRSASAQTWTDLPVPPRSAPGGAAIPELPDERGILEGDRYSTRSSRWIVAGLLDAPFAALFLTAAALAWHHRRRARAERAADARGPLTDGLAVISGVVELLQGQSGPAVEIRIHQRGEETENKGHWTHVWSEIDRLVVARPFHLRRDDGTRVLVEADDKVILHDHLPRIARRAADSRTRTAELTAGKRAHVTGELRGARREGTASAYRGSGAEPTLSAPRLGPMVVSTEPPGATEIARARFHLAWAIGVAVVFAGLAAAFTSGSHALAVDGQTVWATPTALRTTVFNGRAKGGAYVHRVSYALRARADLPGRGEITLEADCGAPLGECLAHGGCARVPFVVAAHAPASIQAIGYGATLTGPIVGALAVALGLVGLIYALSAYQTRPWYQRGRLDEFARGQLDDPAL